jgi:3-hydroxyisobutyrate dehydrogenase-like beta-hydroxyacid dehydrogenase
MSQDVVNASAGASRMFEDRAPRMLDGDFAPHATIGIFLKDLAIALDTARRYGAQTPVATAAQKVFSQAAEAFGSDLGDPAIFRLYQPKDGEQF